MKLWGGRFQKETDKQVDDFNSSIRFDARMYREDITGSIAHAKMLGKQNIIDPAEADLIVKTLGEILEDIEAGKVEFLVDAEDIHMNVEKLLTDRIGAAGKRLHTGRSRNDQVALDIRMYLMAKEEEITEHLLTLLRTLTTLSRAHMDTIMPGYTHLQKAQPITFAHHLMAYAQMFMRDANRIADCYGRTSVMPLGSGALAGTTYPLDRAFVQETLGFSQITDNSLDGVSDRDFALELAADLSILMVHLSRFCEELILWSSHEFSFVEMDDAYSTGSSIMPQKKNPDVAELIRGKSGRVFGDLMGLLTMMKGLPLAYNKDMQEDKEQIFDAVDTVLLCLPVFNNMIATMKIRKDAMYQGAGGGFTNATDAADYLVKKGLPFREAHEILGKLVFYCIGKNCTLDALALAEYKQFSPVFDEDVFAAIRLEACVAERSLPGGPAEKAVLSSIEKCERFTESFSL
ncbi:MAG: argininosuccinate lyase [Ruminococcaceae bacterium]|nr:argininosuccinate lyase [Oscillospiraceae bacterium]